MKKLLLTLPALVLLATGCNLLSHLAPEITGTSNNQTSNTQTTPPTPLNPPKFSFKVAKQYCNSTSPYADITILLDDKTVGSVKSPDCYGANLTVVRQDNNAVYFTIDTNGIGGYILYGKYNTLYQLKLADHKITSYLNSHTLTDVDFSPDGTRVVYNQGVETGKNDIIIRDLNTNQETHYGAPPMKRTDGQFGGYKFSPQGNKVAIGVGYGPDNETGEVYVLDLNTKKYSLYSATKTAPIINGWKDNNTVDWKLN